MTESSIPPRLLIAALADVELGNSSLNEAADKLGIDPGELLGIVEQDEGNLVAAVAEAVSTLRTDPDRVITTSTTAIADATDVLAKRIRSEGHLMSTSELTSSLSTLEKMSQIGLRQAQQIKESMRQEDDDRPSGCLSVMDHRPLPDGQPGFRWLFLPPSHPARRDCRRFDPRDSVESRKAELLHWLNVWFPVHPITGEFVDLVGLVGDGVVIIDAEGRWHGDKYSLRQGANR